MASLNLDLDYFNHPKTVRLVGLLGRGAEVLPVRLWCYCGKFHCDDGRLTNYSPQEIESLAGWWGKEGVMLEAMLRVGFMLKEESGYAMHDWKEHQGHIKVFKVRAVNAAKKRWAKLDASSMREAIDEHDSSNALAGQCSAYSSLSPAGAREEPPPKEQHYPEASRPSWGEFWAYCQQLTLIAEWYAEDKFLAAEQERWKRQDDWKAYARRCRGWWETDGRPMERPTKANGTRHSNPRSKRDATTHAGQSGRNEVAELFAKK